MSETVTKRIYFVRHGETACNARLLVQSPDEPLNESGLMQAAKVATRTQNISFEKIVASDHRRAQQTAQAIAEANGMEVEVSALFGESRPASQFINVSATDPEFLAVQELRREHRNDPAWHFADEENISDIIARAEKALAFLEEDSATEILVVTHGLFLRTLVMKIILRDLLNPDSWYATSGVLRASNTGITVCERVDGQWRVLTWNDHAHFAE